MAKTSKAPPKASTAKTSKHSISGYKKPASIAKHAAIIGKLGGRPREYA